MEYYGIRGGNDYDLLLPNQEFQRLRQHFSKKSSERSVTIFYYLGGSIGAFLGTLAWNIAQWSGVCSVACVMLVGTLSFYVLHGKRIRQFWTNWMG